MNSSLIHCLFGELEYRSSWKVFPSDRKECQHYLESWLTKTIELPREAEPEEAICRRRCDDWERRDISEEVGLISFPLCNRAGNYLDVYQLVCRVYFTWASSGRVSRTCHATIIPPQLWESLEYNPFLVPQLGRSTKIFQDLSSVNWSTLDHMKKSGWTRVREILDTHTDIDFPEESLLALIAGKEPVRLPNETPQWMHELLLLCLPHDHRATIQCWTGPFAPQKEYQPLFALGLFSGEEETQLSQPFDGTEEMGYVPKMIRALKRRDEVTYEQLIRDTCAPETNFGLLTRELDLPNLIFEKPKQPEQVTVPSKDKQKHETSVQVSRFTLGMKLKLSGILLILVAVFVGSHSLKSRGEARTIEQWLSDFKEQKSPIELLSEAEVIYQKIPTASQNSRFTDSIPSVIRLLQTEITSIRDLAEIRTVIMKFDRLGTLNHLQNNNHKIDVPNMLERLFLLEHQSVHQYGQDHMKQREEMLKEMEQFYHAHPDIQPNPHLRQLQKDTKTLQAKIAFSSFEHRWQIGKISFKKNALAALLGDGERFRTDYPGHFQHQLQRLTSKHLAAFEGHYRGQVQAAYTNLRSRVTEKTMVSMNKAVNQYADAMGVMPLTASMSRLRHTRLSSDLMNTKIFQFVIEKKKPKAVITVSIHQPRTQAGPKGSKGHIACQSQKQFSLRSNVNICMVWQTGKKENESVISLYDLINGKTVALNNSYLKITRKDSWPDLEKYIK